MNRLTFYKNQWFELDNSGIPLSHIVLGQE